MKSLAASAFVLFICAAPLAAQPGRATQQQDDSSNRPKIHVESYNVSIAIDPDEHRLDGKADIRFKQADRGNYATFDLDRRLRLEKGVGG